MTHVDIGVAARVVVVIACMQMRIVWFRLWIVIAASRDSIHSCSLVVHGVACFGTLKASGLDKSVQTKED